jgi:hypothetical protein
MQINKDLNDRQFQVALLMDDISEAKAVSDALRDMGIYAHFYSELDEFWVDSNTQTPDLTIIDVKKMSSGTLLFKNHPKVASNSLCYSFFFKEETRPLLSSTYGMSHYGYVRKEINLVGQIQSILRRRNDELHLIEENIQLASRVDRLQKRSQKIINDVQISYNFENQYQAMMDLVDRMGEANSKEDFIKKVSNIFSEWSECSAFGMYHLTENGQKLISMKMSKPKYKELPELWLSRPCNDGIASYAIEMAEEISFDSISKKLKQIKVYGGCENPDVIILARLDEDRLQDFQWGLFEERISTKYKSYLLKNLDKANASTKEVSSWEAFSYMDDVYFHQAKSKHKLMEIDFSSLLNVVKERSGNRFYWKSFFADFNEELNAMLSGDYKISQYGVQNLMLFIDKSTLEVDFNKVKHLVSDFQYYRYFEDSNIMMTQNMYPELKVVAPSSVNFLRQVYSDIMSAGQVTQQRRSSWENNNSREINV